MENNPQSERQQDTAGCDWAGCCGWTGCCCGWVVFVLVIPFLLFFWPSVFPLPPWQFWGLHGSLNGILMDCFPLFLFGGTTNLVLLSLSRKRLMLFLEMPNHIWMPSELLSRIPYYTSTVTRDGYSRTTAYLYRNKYARGCLHVLLYGVMGEVSSRWFFFYAMMVELNVANYLLYGFAGDGILQWFTSIIRPVADVATLHMLHFYLFQEPWVVGAAIIFTSLPWWPQKEYMKRAIPTFLLTWWPGMFFFLLMFKYGLFTAIGVRIIYEIMIQLLVQVLIIRTPQKEMASVPVQPSDQSRSDVSSSPVPSEETGSSSPFAQLFLTITSASAGSVSVQTLPGAALTISITYCSGSCAASKSLRGTKYADFAGNYTWNWMPNTKCRGTAMASVTASFHGQTVSTTTSFEVL